MSSWGTYNAGTPLEVCRLGTLAYSEPPPYRVEGSLCIIGNPEYEPESFQVVQVCTPATSTGGPSINCEGACTVGVELKAAPPDPENVADIGSLFMLFLGAAVMVFCARELLNLFRVNPNED